MDYPSNFEMTLADMSKMSHQDTTKHDKTRTIYIDVMILRMNSTLVTLQLLTAPQHLSVNNRGITRGNRFLQAICIALNIQPPPVNRVSIGSYNGLSPIRCLANVWANAGLFSTGPLGTIFNEILIEIQI